MADYLVHALSPFRILLVGRHEFRADAFVPRLPVGSAVVCAIDAARRDGDPDAIFVGRIGKDCVQAQAAAARLPLCPMWMIKQTPLERPRLARICRLEQCRWFNAAIQSIGLARMTLSDLPNLF